MMVRLSGTNEIELIETPKAFQDAVSDKLAKSEDCNLIKIIKKIEHPYVNKNKEMVVYKAYIARSNLMILMTQFDFSDNVLVDSMNIGDCTVFWDYWNTQHS